MPETNLLLIQENLSPIDHHTTKQYNFIVPAHLKELHLFLTFSPLHEADEARSEVLIKKAIAGGVSDLSLEEWKSEMPLSNLLTVSIDAPDGYRGNAHRKKTEQHHILSKEKASPGFFAGDLLPGMWQASLHMHSVLSPEVQVELAIKGVFE